VKEALTDDERGKLDQYEAGQFNVATLRAGSTLQKAEQDVLLGLTRKRSGYYDPIPSLNEAIKRATASLQIELDSAERASAGNLGSAQPDDGVDFVAAE
jgi:hypothetical protein